MPVVYDHEFGVIGSVMTPPAILRFLEARDRERQVAGLQAERKRLELEHAFNMGKASPETMPLASGLKANAAAWLAFAQGVLSDPRHTDVTLEFARGVIAHFEGEKSEG